MKDNQEFVEKLKLTEDVVIVEREVDWDLEVGAIIRRVCETGASAPFFQNILDYSGHRLLGAPLATYRRLAIALGLSPLSPIPEIAEEYYSRTQRKGIEPIPVKEAPCQEKVYMGKDVDLTLVPSPMVHDGDGGRYIGTWHMVVTKEPDTKEVNWGMYRQMVFDEQHMVGPVFPISDAGKVFYTKFKPLGLPMPFATVIGPDPLSALVASAPSPIPEDIFTGALKGEPVEVVKCKTVDLEVPAFAEYVLEGEILPHVELEEGPFGEYVGYRASPRALRTVYRVNCITHRKDPIFTVSNMGIPVDEGQLLRSFTLSLEMRRLLDSQRIPIKGIHMLPESTHHLVVVAVKGLYSGIATQVANLLFGSKLSPWFHMVMVVDDDVDIYNKDEIIHTFSTRCHPKKGIRIFEQGPGNPLQPYSDLEERNLASSPKVLFDCTFPIHWSEKREKPYKVSFKTVYPKNIQEKVLTHWKDYGFH